MEGVPVMDIPAGRATSQRRCTGVQENIVERGMIAPNITARVGYGLRQAVIEALVHLNVGVVGEEVDLIAVVEFDAGIQEGLDAVGGRRAPLLYGTRIIRQ